ncbi:MAG TPA: AzlD domain-containing protein [Propionibacteriaceae bacterium]|nr:AzlD domain-containing protein [Propionibacteriaceae bacterium]
MTLWGWVLAASAIAFATKLAGYLLPAHWLERDEVARTTAAMTIGLLASLITLNAVTSGRSLVLDSRLLALVAAALALKAKAPFLAVVIVGAATAGLARLAGLP